MRVIAQLVLTFLLNASWQIALLVAFATLCNWLLRGLAARYRHWLWVITLISCLVLPLLSCASLTKTLWRNQQTKTAAAAKPIVISRILSPDVEDIESSNVETPASSIKAEPRRIFSRSPIHVKPSIAEALLALYVLLLLWRVASLIRAWRRTMVIVKSAYEFSFPERAQMIIQRCQTAIGSQRVRLLCSTNVPVPITFGLINPVIILPERLLHEIDEELLTTAIGHELIHVARRDYLANLIYEFIYLPLSFHPAAALVRRRIKQTRELCCDESVAAKLLKPDVYARSLVRMIGWAPPARRLAIDTTIGINESDILEVRIMSLLKTPKLSSRRRALLLIAAALLLLTPCVAAAKFALSFDTNKQEPSSSSPQQTQEFRRKQEREVEELKRQAVELKRQMRTAPETQRAELEARLNEVQRNLDQFKSAGAQAKLLEVQRTLEQFKREKQQQNEQQLRQLRETLGELEKTRPADEARVKEMRDKIAAIEIGADKQKRDLLAQLNDEKKLELKEKLAESGKAYGDGDRKAKLIYKIEPEYTPDAREKKIEGSVLLGVTIDHDGLPQNPQVKRSLYPSLDQSAIDAVRKWRFEPAIKNGQPVSMYITVEIYFRPEYDRFAQEQKEREAREKAEMQERERKEATVTTRRGVTEGERKGEFQGEEYGVLLNREAERRAEREMEVKQKAELASHANISMDRAIQIATSQTPGKVLECSLVGERWEAPGKLGKDSLVLYHVVILSGDDASPVTYHVLVNALDGTIFKTSKEERRIGFAETPGRAPIQGGALNGKAVSLPSPEYPEIAKRAHASGSVTVEITIDETGNVISAHAVSGHPLLQAAAVTAARQASFAPTRLNGEPVKVAGLLVYNFVAQ
jgi:TonB family protein